MLGIEFVNSRDPYPHSLLGVMAEQEMLTPMVASYLLNVERVRVAPTLNGASVIRIEPALTIGETEIERVVQAVERTCGLLASEIPPPFWVTSSATAGPAASGAGQPQGGGGPSPNRAMAVSPSWCTPWIWTITLNSIASLAALTGAAGGFQLPLE